MLPVHTATSLIRSFVQQPPKDGLGRSVNPWLQPPFILFVIGSVWWCVAYLAILVQGYSTRTLTMPSVALALNFSWEVVFGIFYSPKQRNGEKDWVTLALIILWILLDLGIIGVLCLYGPAEAWPFAKRWVLWFLVLVGVAAGLGYWAMCQTYSRVAQVHPDSGAILGSYLGNLVMSVLFVVLYFQTGTAVPYLAAWGKLLGTLLISISNLLVDRAFKRQSKHFYWYLYVMVFLFDLWYVYLLMIPRYGPAVALYVATAIFAAVLLVALLLIPRQLRPVAIAQ